MKAMKVSNDLNVIKISKSQLKAIINEEIERYMTELNPHHDAKTGRLSGPKKGNVYSLSTPAVKAAGWDSDKAKKGITTKKGKQQYKFGMADGDTACGRKTVSGKKITPKKSCSKYPKKYDESGHPLIPSSNDSDTDRKDKLGFPKHLQALGRGVIRMDEDPGDDVVVKAREIIDALKQMIVDHDRELTESFDAGIHKRCNENGYYSLQQAQQKILFSLNAFQLAGAGKLLDPKKA